MTDREVLAALGPLVIAACAMLALTMLTESRRLPAPPTPVPTLARVTPSARGDRPAVLVAPVVGRPTVTARPTATATATLETVSPPAKFSLGIARVTAYCEWGTMRDGTYTRPGSVAVDPRILPLGTRLEIEGVPGIQTARDTGSGVKGLWIDRWLPTCGEAIEWGSQWREAWRVE